MVWNTIRSTKNKYKVLLSQAVSYTHLTLPTNSLV